ncbi:gibberellin-regulated protein 13-like [Vigna unguiculata]|uniref:Gibberellin regulated protein n=1 Tax=Vigna unguiculata TaxID=3917 RepID=A0A4D6MZV4_VIGUN|nr:gibberellin-regulated protein 13-like [Vigna unguiculata]QCE05395.1 Gibberellin regulated protein [Vigna unguiculata]
MATNLTIILFCLLHMLLLFKETRAKILVATTESPTPAPAPAPAPAPQSNKHGTTEGSLQPQDCGPRCADRCSNTQYKKPCLFFCQKCCAKCLCVPPGTYGNKEVCPCYNNWKTKRGGPKCP